jgi:hypothetical protein
MPEQPMHIAMASGYGLDCQYRCDAFLATRDLREARNACASYVPDPFWHEKPLLQVLTTITLRETYEA